MPAWSGKDSGGLINNKSLKCNKCRSPSRTPSKLWWKRWFTLMWTNWKCASTRLISWVRLSKWSSRLSILSSLIWQCLLCPRGWPENRVMRTKTEWSWQRFNTASSSLQIWLTNAQILHSKLCLIFKLTATSWSSLSNRWMLQSQAVWIWLSKT